MCRSIRKPCRLGPWAATGKKTSRHRGVSWHKATQKWQARTEVGGESRSLGVFDDEDEAARVYAAASAACGEAGHGPTPPAPEKTSRHRGVSWHQKQKMWRAQISVDGKSRGLGYFNDEAEAASAYAAACREAGRDPTPPAPEKTSRYRGVCWDRKGNKWRARIKLGGKEWNLGGYEDEEAAAGAFLAACLNARDDPSWTPPPFCPG